jgi:hypothetical protein
MKTKIIIIQFLFIIFCANKIEAQTILSDSILTKPVKTYSDSITVNVEANYLRHYIWRAIAFGNDDVAQPIIAATYKKFTLNLSANINYVPKNVPKEFYDKEAAFDEQDIEIAYDDSYKKLAYTIKLDAYFYFHQPLSPSTAEAYIGFEHPIFKNFTAFTENVFDIRAYKGAFFNHTGIRWNKEKGKNAFLLQSSVGLGNNKFNQTYFPNVTTEAVNENDIPLTKGGISYVAFRADYTRTFKNYYARISAEQNYYRRPIKEAAGICGTNNFSFTIGKDLTFGWKK